MQRATGRRNQRRKEDREGRVEGIILCRASLSSMGQAASTAGSELSLQGIWQVVPFFR